MCLKAKIDEETEKEAQVYVVTMLVNMKLKSHIDVCGKYVFGSQRLRQFIQVLQQQMSSFS